MRQPLRHGPIPGNTVRFNASVCIRRCPAASVRRVAARQVAVSVVADLNARGRAVLPKSITVQRIMGEGSFGQVFEGSISTPAGNQRVVLKRVKTRVQGAESMSQMEHLLNVYASRVARGHCADFLGYCEVAEIEASGRLTSGLWLVWKYEGKNTLSYYISRRDTLRALATDMEVDEVAAVPTVMKHVFEGLAAFHAAGLVHRDIKPLNIIFAEDNRRFKLIDLGACADLRSGTNYVPEESILDLNYCPPEQFVMPTDSPHIAKQGLFKLAISPMLWAKHKPDRFDTWSAGIVMLQLAVPAMRSDRALRNFNAAYGPKYRYDLSAWRKGTHLSSRDSAVLDSEDGAGWEMLQSLLAPRHIQVDGNGGVIFVNDSPFPRISAYEALKHRYIKVGVEGAAAPPQPAVTASRAPTQSVGSGNSGRGSMSTDTPAAARNDKPGSGSAVAPVPSSASATGSGPGGSSPGSDPLASAMGLWRDMTGKLFELEAKILRQASATELQTTTVKRLKEQVDRGKADPVVLQQEEKVLGKMQARLVGLQQDFKSTANQASGILGFFGLGRKPQQQAAPPPQPQPPVAASGMPFGFRGSNDRSKASLDALRAAEAASAASSSAASSSSPAPTSAAGMFSSMWERLSNGLGDLETKVSNQASATERQSQVVRGLRAKVDAGEAEPELLNRAERTLGRMERRLLSLDRDYRAAKQGGSGALEGNVPSGLGASRGGSSGKTAPSVAVPAEEGARSSGSDNEASGSFWSQLTGRSWGGSSGSSMDGSSKGSSLSAAAAAQAAPAPSQEPPRPSAPPRSSTPFFRRAVSPTAASQQQNLQQTQQQPQQPQQQPAAYRSIFGAFGGGSSSGRSTTPSRGAAAAASSAAAPSPNATPGAGLPLARSVSPRSASLFSGLFGRPAAQPQQQPAPPPPPRAKSAVPAAASSAPVVPPPTAATPAASGDALVEGANRVIRNSLGFTGLAAKIAGDLASALKADADRYFKELEAQEVAKRQQRTVDLAFMALLREAAPPVSSASSYEEAEARFGGVASWAELADEGRRRQLYGSYLLAAKKMEAQAAAAAEAGFRAALRRYHVSAGSQWEQFSDTLSDSDPTLAAVQDPARRQQLFTEVIAELQLQAALAKAAEEAEREFTALLAELRDPPVTSTSTWSLVRRAGAADPRCQALPEQRRRELFEAYTAQLFEAEARRAEEAVGSLLDATPAAATAAVQAAVIAVPEPTPIGVATSMQPAVPAAPVQASAPLTVTATSTSTPPPADAGVAASVIDDDDLAAALEDMEAALESAIKAVASGPLPSATILDNRRDASSGGNLASVSSEQLLGSKGLVNGKPKQAAPVPGAAPAGSGVSVFDGSRLEELRREQARLRTEYEAMAQRLREMEERLRSQAQLITSVDDAVAAPQAPSANADGIATSNGGSGRAPSDVRTNDVSASARGMHWR